MEKAVKFHENLDLDHRFFSYLTEEEKEDILKSHIPLIGATFFLDNVEKFKLIIENRIDCFHVRECGGHFLRHVNDIENLVYCMALKYGKPEISFSATRKAMTDVGDRLGFTWYDDQKFETYVFTKRVNHE